jgi:hypothetical protein
MNKTLLDATAVLAQQHIEELLRDAENERLVRKIRRARRKSRSRVATSARLRPATMIR